MADHNRRGDGGYADHRRGSFTDHRRSPYQRPRSSSGGRGSHGQNFIPLINPSSRSTSSGSVGSSSRGFSFSSDFGDAFRRPTALSSSLQSQGSRSTSYNIRPVISGAQTTTFTCNYVKLELSNSCNLMIWEYDVQFKPEVSDRIRRSYVANKHFHTVTNSSLKVYDQGSIIWSPIKTEKEISEGTYELRNGEKVTVSLKRKFQRNICECKIIPNVIIKRIMTELQMVPIKRAHYQPDLRRLSREFNIEIWPGFKSAVDEFKGGFFLNIDVSFKVLQNTTVWSILTDIMKRCDVATFKERAYEILLGSSIMTKYNNKIVRIDDIDFDTTPQSVFERNGEKITYLDYYKIQYNINILDKGQPMLVNRVKRRPAENQDADEVLNLYVPELCHITGISEQQRADFRFKKNFSEMTKLNPQKRNEDISRFLQNINENVKCKTLLADWGLKIHDHPIELQGRTMEPEIIYFGKNRTTQDHNADWGRVLSREPLLNPVPLNEWVVVYTRRDERTVDMFLRKLLEAGQRMGISTTMPKHKIKLDSDRPEEYCKHLKELKNIRMAVIIFPSRRNDRYITVKRICHERGLPSQVINTKTINNPQRLDGIVQKILMQINCKIGGSLWAVSIPHEEEGIMICGLDMSHDSGKLRPTDSSVALVASVNKNATRWTSSCILVPPGQNIIDQMAELFEPCLREWFQSNGQYPKYLVVYRVGIDDGQLDTVREMEIGLLKRVFSQIKSGYQPGIIYIVVVSRNNTRFYSKVNGMVYNPNPGTVIDDTITRKNMTDFYLVSPSVRQGTVAPTHYIVVENSSKMPIQVIQSLTYKMTHLYYNWTASIRVPAPCQYAQRLAQQVGLRINPPTSPNMKKTLFFL